MTYMRPKPLIPILGEDMIIKTGRDAQRLIEGRGKQRDDVNERFDRVLDNGNTECANAGTVVRRLLLLLLIDREPNDNDGSEKDDDMTNNK